MATQDVPRMPSSALPPSPPPSPPRRRHKKHRSDPFLELDNTPLTSPSPPSSPTDKPEEPQDPLVVRAILTPLYFISFILSLFLINRSDRLRRTNSSSPSVFSYFSPGYWIDPEPYQDPDSSAWNRRDSSAHIEPNPTFQNEKRKKQKRRESSWHLHKKIRKVAKLEISDAFEMRGRVIIFLISLFTLLVVGAVLGLKWAFAKIWWGGR